MNSRPNRREWLRYGAAGLVGVGAYKGLEYSGWNPLLAQKKESREHFEGIRESLGQYIYLTPTKLGGATHAVDLKTMKQLAWIAYWNYGDSCPISHHLAAYPGEGGDPYKGFEFINSTQGGDNVLMYGIPTQIKQRGLLDRHGQGNHIYRVGYNGKVGQMELLEDISETTGIGLGVHTCIYPDAEGFACADGQKDVAAFFNRARGPQKTRVHTAFRADWIPRFRFLGDCWLKGGTIRLTRLEASRELGVYDYQGTRGNKINYEMAPMAELLVERGQIPGDDPMALTGLDFALHHPGNRWSVLGLRMCGGGFILDRKNWEPVCFVQANDGIQDNFPLKKVSNTPETWEVSLPAVGNPIHESGFHPTGNQFVMMNNLRANNVAIFDTADPDPRRWKRVRFLGDPEWKGEFPSPFHVAFSVDGTKCFFTVLRPKPMKSDVYVADVKTWKIIKKFRNVGIDTQTMALTYDGKYVIVIFSGFQRMESGAFVFRQDTLEAVGYMPNFGGHHDCVIVPSKPEELVFSRSTCV
ncbi:MAG: hypothetical protein U0840_19175 [Gemmataceae bacterium]